MSQDSKRDSHISSSTLHDMFQNSPLCILTSEPEDRFVSANPAMAKMFGYDSSEELISYATNIAQHVY